jgi:hypothetical protein
MYKMIGLCVIKKDGKWAITSSDMAEKLRDKPEVHYNVNDAAYLQRLAQAALGSLSSGPQANYQSLLGSMLGVSQGKSTLGGV